MKSILSLLVIIIFILVLLSTNGFTEEFGKNVPSGYIVGLPMVSKAGSPIPAEPPPMPVNEADLPPMPCLGGIAIIAIIPFMLILRLRNRLREV